MAYTKEQIEECKEILDNYKKQVNELLSPEDNRFRCDAFMLNLVFT